MLISLVELFSTQLGTAYYAFAVQLTLSVALLAMVYLGIKTRALPSTFSTFSLVVVTLFQLALGNLHPVLALLSQNLTTLYPLYDRTLLLLQILWVFPVLNSIGKGFLLKTALILLTALLMMSPALMIRSFPALWQLGNFNFSDQAFYWSLAIFILAMVLFALGDPNQQPLTWLSRLFYLLVMAGAAADMVFIPFPGDHAGFVRLGLLMAIPLLLIVPPLVQPATREIDQTILRAFIRRIEETTDEFIEQNIASGSISPATIKTLEVSTAASTATHMAAVPADTEDWTEEHTALLNEVKQPLFSIVGYADLLARQTHGTLDEVQKKYVDRIRAAASSIEHKVDEISRLREVELGTVRYIPELVDLEKVCDIAMAAYEASLRERSLEVVREINLTNTQLVADRTSIQSVINLALENAIGASKPNSKITLTANDSREVAGFLRLTIRDEGEGILPEDLPKVFEKRLSVSAPLITGVGDKGVGLNILRSLVVGMRGTVEVISSLGEGTSLVILLPRNIAGSFQPVNLPH